MFFFIIKPDISRHILEVNRSHEYVDILDGKQQVF
ncbi:uncharacterized protein METZ01_LOCUS202927 [marine metagenome]|uniref:Uncharacterized protein n=1 Tax=marine metagenome TaxID=408172 RepID=A0A382EJH9_9ZZZZ